MYVYDDDDHDHDDDDDDALEATMIMDDDGK
jgi:hypothetical protein